MFSVGMKIWLEKCRQVVWSENWFRMKITFESEITFGLKWNERFQGLSEGFPFRRKVFEFLLIQTSHGVFCWKTMKKHNEQVHNTS